MAFSMRVTVFPEQAMAEARHESTEERAQIAHEAAGDARADAPVLDGDYRDGIGVEVNGDQVTIVDNDPESIYKEFGTSDTPAHATLVNAASNYGKYSGWKPRRR